MLEKLIAYLRKLHANRPGKHLPGRIAARAAAVEGTVMDRVPEGVVPDMTTMFFAFELNDGAVDYARLNMDRGYLERPDAFRLAMERTVRHYRLHERREIRHIRLLTYDQYIQGIQSCTDKTPVDLHV